MQIVETPKQAAAIIRASLLVEQKEERVFVLPPGAVDMRTKERQK